MEGHCHSLPIAAMQVELPSLSPKMIPRLQPAFALLLSPSCCQGSFELAVLPVTAASGGQAGEGQQPAWLQSAFALAVPGTVSGGEAEALAVAFAQVTRLTASLWGSSSFPGLLGGQAERWCFLQAAVSEGLS